jgi:hypothetical protein
MKRHADWWRSWRQPMKNDGVAFVHGSSSASLQGVAKFGAVLSMEDISKRSSFFPGGLSSGERDWTIKGLKYNADISKGVSLIRANEINHKISAYASGSGEHYPVVYAFDDRILLNNAPRMWRPIPMWHHLSQGSIGIDHIVRIYVPMGRGDETRNRLLAFGAESLSERVQESSIFEYDWGPLDYSTR